MLFARFKEKITLVLCYDCFGIIHDRRPHNCEDADDEAQVNNRCTIGDHSLAYFPTIGEERLTVNSYIEKSQGKDALQNKIIY